VGTSAGGESRDDAQLCAGARSAILDAEAQALRARAEERGITVEERIAQQADDQSGTRAIWRCPGRDPAYHLAQPTVAPRALPGGGSARLLAVDLEDEEGAIERVAFVVIQLAGRAPHFERIGAARDMGHGQEWQQLAVRALEARGDVVEVTAESQDCVPAGHTDDTFDEPPECVPISRFRITCTTDSSIRCEHAEVELERP
jgi:hypothetical protein